MTTNIILINSRCDGFWQR